MFSGKYFQEILLRSKDMSQMVRTLCPLADCKDGQWFFLKPSLWLCPEPLLGKGLGHSNPCLNTFCQSWARGIGLLSQLLKRCWDKCYFFKPFHLEQFGILLWCCCLLSVFFFLRQQPEKSGAILLSLVPLLPPVYTSINICHLKFSPQGPLTHQSLPQTQMYPLFKQLAKNEEYDSEKLPELWQGQQDTRRDWWCCPEVHNR